MVLFKQEKYLGNKGFTLIELIIAIGMFAIIAFIIADAYTDQQGTQTSQIQTVEMQQNIRAAMMLLSRELRMAGYDPDMINTAGLVNIGDGSAGNPLSFTYFDENISADGLDNDNDGVIDDPDEMQLIQYGLYDAYGDGDLDIGRSSGAGNFQVIAENIQALQFVYLDAGGNATVIPNNIRAVRVTITATPDISERNLASDNRTITSVIKFRNIF